jgi:hypothetical protein
MDERWWDDVLATEASQSIGDLLGHHSLGPDVPDTSNPMETIEEAEDFFPY